MTAADTYRQTMFLAMCKSHGLPEPVPELRFNPQRFWRFDWAWLAQMIALEIQGGLWVAGGGRHQRGAALLREMEKLNAAACLGWRILYATPDQVTTGEIFLVIRQALHLEGP
jgi:hypothetical protein